MRGLDLEGQVDVMRVPGDTPQSPPKANPLTSTAALDLTIVLLVTLVKKERGTKRLTGTVLNSVSPGFTFAWGVSGTRYPIFSK
jgi:hypothetical protein